ncbi:peptide chain release factor 2, partial [bacterium]|nr:peptide chain release factor 2 [candidate division CSSED10-310 bacterium]
MFDLPGLEAELEDLGKRSSAPDIWNDPQKAQQLFRERSTIQKKIDMFESFSSRLGDLKAMAELMEEDVSFGDELQREFDKFSREFENYELAMLLSGENDPNNAFLSIHPGAGGTESQDWAEMLFRMFTRYAEQAEYEFEIVEYQHGDEAGIKSATILVKGDYAYGFLKSETGVHRLVRISPFDANKRRHTSFASVFVYPEVSDDIEVEIDPGDLRIDTYRSSGAGGQHVNVTDSAVRLTHLPTGIVVACQNERSQHRNRDMAMKILRARLYDKMVRERDDERDKLHAGKKEIAWGSQIRS